MAAVHWVRFRALDGRIGFGAIENQSIVEFAGDMFDAPRPTGVILEKDAYTLLAPCVPSKMVALWNNFHALSAKMGKQEPVHALFLLKPASCVIGPNEPILRPADYHGKIVYEGELGIVIGRRCKNVTVDQAASHIFGFTCVNDVTAADILNESPDFAQWCRSKSFDTFGIIGPAILTEFDWAEARVVTKLGGLERQNYQLSDMILSPLDVVSQVSHDMTLLPGDVIACGTSLGVGSIREGVDIEVQIERIGSLINVLPPLTPAVPVAV